MLFFSLSERHTVAGRLNFHVRTSMNRIAAAALQPFWITAVE